MLEDVGLSLNLLKIFVQHRARLLAQQCCAMLASFEQALGVCISLHPNKLKKRMNKLEVKYQILGT